MSPAAVNGVDACRALASLATLATTGTPKDVDWAMEEAEDLKQAEAQGFGCSLS